MRVTRFDLLLLRPEMTASAARQQTFQAARAGVPLVELASDFSTHDAGEPGAESDQAQQRTGPDPLTMTGIP